MLFSVLAGNSYLTQHGDGVTNLNKFDGDFVSLDAMNSIMYVYMYLGCIFSHLNNRLKIHICCNLYTRSGCAGKEYAYMHSCDHSGT